jgi:RecA-family ATPase
VSELQKTEIPPIRWIVSGLLPEGLALLAAPSKYGKSWMMMQLCIAVAEGRLFLERQTVKCDVAYFSLEDSKRRFKDRVNKITGNKPAPQGYFGTVKALSMATGLFEQL